MKPGNYTMKRQIFAILALLLFASPAFADDTPQWLQQAAAIKAATYDKDVSAVVLLDESLTSINSDGRETELYNRAVRILRKEGRGYAIGQVGYVPETGKVKEFRAWLIKPNGEVKKFGKDDSVDIQANLNDVYNEYRFKRISAKDDAEVGAVFAYSYTLEDRLIFSQADWAFQNSLPVISSRYNLTLPEGWRAEGVTFNHAPIEPRVNGSSYSWELSNL